MDPPEISVRAKWAIAFLIGLATVTAATFTWRAAQIGSTAAYDDRQSISETVRTEQGEVERTIAIAAAAREYVRYRADYGVAAALDREAARLTAAGADGSPTSRAPRRPRSGKAQPAARPRRACSAARRSEAISSSRAPLRAPSISRRGGGHSRRSSRPRSTRRESSTPRGSQRQADDIRDRVNGLVRFAFVIAFAVLLYTLAEVSTRRRTTASFAVAGYRRLRQPPSSAASRPTSSHERARVDDNRRPPSAGTRSRGRSSDPLKPKIAVTLAVVVVIAGMLAVLQTQAGANESTTARETTRTAVRAMSANVATSTLLGVRSEVRGRARLPAFPPPLGRRHARVSRSRRARPRAGLGRRGLAGGTAAPDEAAAQRTGPLQLDAERQVLKQQALATTRVTWNTRSTQYTTVLAVLAAALFLVGFGLVVEGSIRRVTYGLGLAIAAFVVVWGAWIYHLPIPSTPDNAITAAAQGAVLTSDGDYRGAVAAYDRAIAAHEDFATAYTGRARARLLAANPDYPLTRAFTDSGGSQTAAAVDGRAARARPRRPPRPARRRTPRARRLLPRRLRAGGQKHRRRDRDQPGRPRRLAVEERRPTRAG